MTVGFVCNRTVVLVRADESLLVAARLMRDEHVGSLVVVDASAPRRPVGVLTDRDLVVGVMAQDPEDLGRLLVGDVLRFRLVTARDSESIDDAVALMLEHGVRRLPVVDAQGELVGILTLDDLLELFGEHLAALGRIVGKEQEVERRTRPPERRRELT